MSWKAIQATFKPQTCNGAYTIDYDRRRVYITDLEQNKGKTLVQNIYIHHYFVNM